MEEELTVRQRQYAFCTSESKYKNLITRSILVCTGVFGIDRKSGVSFLAHFDLPWSTNKLPQIVDEAIEKAGEDSQFELEIVNGNLIVSILFVCSAFITRRFLFKNFAKCKNVSLKNDHGFSLSSLRRDISFENKNRYIDVIPRYNILTNKNDKAISCRMKEVENPA